MGAGKRKNSVEDAPSSSFSERDAAQPSADVEKRANKQDVPTGDPFGDESSAAVQYRTMEWWQASLVMIAETVSLGILSLPSVLAGVGIIAGVILIVGIGIIATYTGYVFGQFKARYPHVHNMADAGEVVLGRFGKEIFGAAQVIFLIFVVRRSPPGQFDGGVTDSRDTDGQPPLDIHHRHERHHGSRDVHHRVERAWCCCVHPF